MYINMYDELLEIDKEIYEVRKFKGQNSLNLE